MHRLCCGWLIAFLSIRIGQTSLCRAYCTGRGRSRTGCRPESACLRQTPAFARHVAAAAHPRQAAAVDVPERSDDRDAAATDDRTDRRQNATSRRCVHCSRTFDTRNALFRHLRSDPDCSVLASAQGDLRYTKRSLAFKVAYHSASDPSGIERSLAEDAANAIQSNLMTELNSTILAHFNATRTSALKLVSTMQASVARMRHRVLGQEPHLGASADVVVVTVYAPDVLNTALWKRIFKRLRRATRPDIIVNRVRILEDAINVERACTQQVRHYLLPLRWLPDGTDVQRQLQAELGARRPGHTLRFRGPVPDSLVVFKEALRLAESPRKPRNENEANTERHSSRYNSRFGSASSSETRVSAGIDDYRNPHRQSTEGRFGALRFRHRRPWHNFADPDLRGDASPSNDPVWKVVDRARVVDFITSADSIDDELYAVLEIAGEDFLPQQVERIVASAVAIAHGWLPENFFELATNSKYILSTPVAPRGLSYNAGCRFHFEELKWKGRRLFDVDEAGNLLSDKSVNTQRWIQQRIIKTHSTIPAPTRSGWLEDMERIVSPKIRAQLLTIQDETPINYRSETNHMPIRPPIPVPHEYSAVLCSLRDIVHSEAWPETSPARSSVIRRQGSAEQSSDKTCQNGSFTVFNELDFPNATSLPLGNTLFPQLTRSVFQLERVLSTRSRDCVTVNGTRTGVTVNGTRTGVTVNGTRTGVTTVRTPSTHCAVNCNAQFTPHVDSGRGAGQSLSMIVGLGNYDGGELFVEGDMYDIQYRPLEFDGWKLRHWTNQFRGERFSLVWFTPEAT